MRHFGVTFCAALILAPLGGLAQSQYSADDIVEHFKPVQPAVVAPNCPEGAICLPKKKTRAVCIGAQSQCAGGAPATAEVGAFDLLITFELGSDRLSEQAKRNLDEFARALTDEKLSDIEFNVDGHTDARGSNDFNEELSRRRAESVVEYLEARGVSRARLQANGYGETRPRVDDPFADINRRVEARIRTR